MHDGAARVAGGIRRSGRRWHVCGIIEYLNTGAIAAVQVGPALRMRTRAGKPFLERPVALFPCHFHSEPEGLLVEAHRPVPVPRADRDMMNAAASEYGIASASVRARRSGLRLAARQPGGSGRQPEQA